MSAKIKAYSGKAPINCRSLETAAAKDGHSRGSTRVRREVASYGARFDGGNRQILHLSHQFAPTVGLDPAGVVGEKRFESRGPDAQHGSATRSALKLPARGARSWLVSPHGTDAVLHSLRSAHKSTGPQGGVVPTAA